MVLLLRKPLQIDNGELHDVGASPGNYSAEFGAANFKKLFIPE